VETGSDVIPEVKSRNDIIEIGESYHVKKSPQQQLKKQAQEDVTGR